MDKLVSCIRKPSDEQKKKSGLGCTAGMSKSIQPVQGGKPKSMKSETDDQSTERKLTRGPVELQTESKLTSGPIKLQTERKLASGPIKLQTERKLASGPIKLQTERKLTSGPIKLQTERKLTRGPIKLQTERKLTSGSIKLQTEQSDRKLTSRTSELPAARKPRSVTNELSKEGKSASLTLTNELLVKKNPSIQTYKLSADRKSRSETDELLRGSELTFVCISDTHCKLNKDDIGRIPHGDVLLHTGDFTMNGTVRELLQFNNFLGALSHTYKVVIAGNHDSCLEEDQSWDSKFILQHCRNKYGVHHIRNLLTNCIYLQDELTDICGIKIYGAPWTPMYSVCDAFSLSERETREQKWDKIPDYVDILMTHGPPRGFGDTTTKGASAGCSSLTETVHNRVKPKYHIFGHIHEGYGIYRDEETTFINASVCTRGYKPKNKPIKFRLSAAKSSTCDSDSDKVDTQMNTKSFNSRCDKNGCDNFKFVNSDNGCDLNFVSCGNRFDTSEFINSDNGCDTADSDNCCDTADSDSVSDSELSKLSARPCSCKTETEMLETKLRDCASNWNWDGNDGTELNYTKLTTCERNMEH